MNFGERVKQVRTEKGLTQPQLAQMAGVEQSYLSKLENDKSVPSAEMFTTILAGLDMDESTFLKPLGRDALATTLNHIPAVTRYTAQAAIVQSTRSKRWIYGSALAWILGFAMMLGADSGIFLSNSQHTYRSPGVILAGEAENVFDNNANVLGLKVGAGIISVEEMSKQLAEFQATRVRPLTIVLPDHRGGTFVEAVDGGQRRFTLEQTKRVDAMGNCILQFLGAIVIMSGFVGLFLEWRLRRLA